MEAIRHSKGITDTNVTHVSCLASHFLLFLLLSLCASATSECVQSDKVRTNRILEVSKITEQETHAYCNVNHPEVKIFALEENLKKNNNVATILFCPSPEVPEITIAFQMEVIGLRVSQKGNVTADRLPSNSVQIHVIPATPKTTVLPQVYVQLKTAPGKPYLGRMYVQCGDTLDSMEDYELWMKERGSSRSDRISKSKQLMMAQRQKRTASAEKSDMSDQSVCGQTHSCFRYGTQSCQHMACNYFVSYRVDNEANGRSIHLEISGKTNGWMAMGFSSDNKMGGADIIACVKKDLRSSEFRVAAYSTSYYHDTPTEKESYSNLTQYKEEDGFVYCHIQIPFKQRTGPDGRYFDLSNDWYQLYAWGNIDAGGKIEKHIHLPLTSSDKVSVLYIKRNEYGSAIQLKGGNLIWLSVLVWIANTAFNGNVAKRG